MYLCGWKYLNVHFMKKTFIAAVLLLFAFGNAMAQREANLQQVWNTISNQVRGEQWIEVIKPETVYVDFLDGNNIVTTKYDFTYDEDSYDLIIRETYRLVSGDNWDLIYTETYEYDFYGNVIEALKVDSDGENVSLETYSYDDDILSLVLYQDWNGTEWVNVSKEEYNFTNVSLAMLYSVWNGSTWSPTDLYTITQTDNVVEVLKQYMQGGAWQNETLQLSTYNDDDLVTEILYKKWDGTSWVNDRQKTYSYSNGLMDRVYEKKWDQGTWSDYYKFEYQYDDQGNAIIGFCYFKKDGWVNANGDLEMTYHYNEGSDVYYGCVVRASYLDVTGIDEETVPANFTFYSNPVKNVLMIRMDDFKKAEVYSLTGVKLMESTSNNFNVSNLRSGAYLLRVYDVNGGNKTRVFVVK